MYRASACEAEHPPALSNESDGVGRVTSPNALGKSLRKFEMMTARSMYISTDSNSPIQPGRVSIIMLEFTKVLLMPVNSASGIAIERPRWPRKIEVCSDSARTGSPSDMSSVLIVLQARQAASRIWSKLQNGLIASRSTSAPRPGTVETTSFPFTIDFSGGLCRTCT